MNCCDKYLFVMVYESCILNIEPLYEKKDMVLRFFFQEVFMAGRVAIVIQDFGDLIQKKYLYIDKTLFIKEWWECGDSVTLITRPRRFGKTLNMSMLERFFSVRYAGQGELFEGLSIWEDKAYQEIQGTYPVISLSFANVKETNYENTKERICQLLTNLYTENFFLRDSEVL